MDIEVSPWGTDHRGVVGSFTVTPGDVAPFAAVDQRLLPPGDTTTMRMHGSDAPGECFEIRRAGSTGTPFSAACIDGSRNASGELDAAKLGAGDYEVRLLGADGAALAVAPFSVVAAGTMPKLAVDAPSYASGAPITASWRNGPGSRWDWLGVYAHGADPLVDSYLGYVYTGQTVAGSVVIDEGAEGDWPLPPGTYDVHYLLDDGYTSLAVASFTITK